MVTRHYVIRTYSGHAARKTLWQVLSRGIKDKRDAEHELSWHQGMEEYPDKHDYFLITKEDDS